MSADGSYLFCTRGAQRFYYSRWGGLYLDKALLAGPERFLAQVQRYPEIEAPFFESWLEGIVKIDSEQRHLRYWASQGCGYSAVDRRMFQALLASIWTGWSLEWMPRPALALGAPSPKRQRPLCSLEEAAVEQSSAWEEAHQSWKDLEGLIVSEGEDAVRSWVEDDFDLWISLRSEEGLRDELLNRNFCREDFLLFGPDLLKLLERRPKRDLEQIWMPEHRLGACCFVDLPARRLCWWMQHPPWGLILDLERAWSGWSFEWMLDGPADQLRATGREPQSLLHSSCLKQMRGWMEQLMGPETSPAQLLENVARQVKLKPGEHLRITPPGPALEKAGAAPGAQHKLWSCFKALLKEAEFQPGNHMS